MKAIVLICVLALSFLMKGNAAIRRPLYEVVEIRADGTNVPAYPGTLRINNSNRVSGSVSVVEPSPHFESFLWKDGEPIRWLGEGRIDDINDEGDFVGSVAGAEVWRNGQVQTFAINNARQAVGSDEGHAFITDSNGQTTILGPTVFSEARSVNSAGIAAGIALLNPGSPITPVIFTSTNIVDLGWIRGTSASETTVINDRNHVLFTATLTNRFRVRSYLFRNNKPKPLPTLPGSRHTVAFAMNNADEIVGFFGRNNAPVPRGSSGAITVVGAFLYFDGKLYNLDKLLTPESRGWHVSEALDINDAGAIAAFAARPGEQRVPVLLRRLQR